MIKGFADPGTQQIFKGKIAPGLPPQIQKTARRRLLNLDAAVSLQDLAALPGNRLHALKRNRAGQHSISINDQWRICFRWNGGHAYAVEIVDYH